MKQAALFALLLALPACSLTRLSVSDYTAAGKDKTLMDADAADCDKRAERDRPSAFNDTLAVETQYNRIYGACMEEKGYKLR